MKHKKPRDEQFRDASLELKSDDDIIRVRRSARSWARDLGFGLASQSIAVMCVTELAENAIKHAKGGICRFSKVQEDGQYVFRIDVEDRGSGIRNLSRVLRERFDSEYDPLGTGLAGVRRVSDIFEIIQMESGMSVRIGFFLPQEIDHVS